MTRKVGQLFGPAFLGDGDGVEVLSRGEEGVHGRVMGWAGATVGARAQELDGAGVVINLAGRTVNCGCKPVNRRAGVESRLNFTRALNEATNRATTRPRVWLQLTPDTIDAVSKISPNDEVTA